MKRFLGRIKFGIKRNLSRLFLYFFILPGKAFGVEIGVWRGNNAKLLYAAANPNILVLVDPYLESFRKLEERKEAYERVKRWTEGRRALVVRLKSEIASDYFKNIDWIYIDGDHKDLYSDLLYWYHNVRPGGIICGDDYSDAFPEVKEDVKLFCQENGLKLHTLHYQWWFKKPNETSPDFIDNLNWAGT